MKTRIISAAVLIPLLLILLIALPKYLTALLFGIMGVIAVYELLYTTKFITHVRLLAYTMLTAFCVALWSYFGAKTGYFPVLVLLIYFLMFAEMMLDQKNIQVSQIAMCMMAGLLIPYMLNSLVRIFIGTQGRYLVFIPFVITILADSGAYFAGRAFGKHKLAPTVSPNKTVEGVVGGVIAAILGLIIYGMILRFAFGFRVNFGYALVYGTFGSLGSVFGDLSLSVIKRQTGIKDYGKLIPGHGGILDRFDSMLVVGPMMELLMILLPMAVR